MKHLLLLILVSLLGGCAATPAVLTTVVNAPVRVSCVTTLPADPVLVTPCAGNAPIDECQRDYQLDVATLLGHTNKLTDQLKACK